MEFLESRMQKAVEAEKLDRIKQKKDADKAQKINWEEGLKAEIDGNVEQTMESETLAGDVSHLDVALEHKGTEADPSADNPKVPDDKTHPESTIQQSSSKVDNDPTSNTKAAGSGSVRGIDTRLERGDRNNNTQVVIDWRPKP